MGVGQIFYDTRRRRLGPLLRGWLAWYQPRPGPAYSAAAGWRLLAVVVVLELLIGPRTHILTWLGLQQPETWVRVASRMALALVAVRLLAGVRLRDIGLVPPTEFRLAESLYLAQALLIGGAVFVLLRGRGLGLFGSDPAAWAAAGALVGTQMLWGFYQELVYRGMLQTELARRFGGVMGALLANLAFTFGPLHLYHLTRGGDPMTAGVTLAAVFAIGLVFALIFGRSRNLWLVGLLHGIGNIFGNVTG